MMSLKKKTLYTKKEKHIPYIDDLCALHWFRLRSNFCCSLSLCYHTAPPLSIIFSLLWQPKERERYAWMKENKTEEDGIARTWAIFHNSESCYFFVNYLIKEWKRSMMEMIDDLRKGNCGKKWIKTAINSPCMFILIQFKEISRRVTFSFSLYFN